MALVYNWQIGRKTSYWYPESRPKRQFAAVFDVNKCIACQTCTLACKTTWTSGRGQEYMLWNNVESKPRGFYPLGYDVNILSALGPQRWQGERYTGRTVFGAAPGDRADLDALLSVELSAFRTPRRTRKLLAVTAEGNPGEAAKDRGDARRTMYCLDNLIDGWKTTASDREMLDAATRYFSGTRHPELVPSRVAEEHAAMEAGLARIRELEARLEGLGKSIAREHVADGGGGDNGTRRIRAMAEEFRSLETAYDNAVAAYNRSLRGLRGSGYGTNFLVSLGGGIDLRPRDFAIAP